MKRAILTYYNDNIDKNLLTYQQKVLDKFNTTADYHPLLCKQGIDQIIHYQALDYGVGQLFSEQYDSVLILDIDCIPLNSYALEYIFERAEQNVIIGNAQRSGHIENNEHLYIGSSCFCLNRQIYEDFGQMTFAPDHIKADTCEHYTYEAEKRGVEFEIFMPKSYIRQAIGCDWDLGKGRPKYGIGTTFMNSLSVEMFFHLFSSRDRVYNAYFYDKCEQVLS
jgi:hypothetical protein